MNTSSEPTITEEPQPQKEEVVIEPYQFRFYSRPSRATFKLIRHIHEDFAKQLTSTLKSFLNTQISIELINIDKKGLKKFLLSLNDPTFLAKLDNASIDSFGFLEINSLIVYSALNKMLGIKNETEFFSSNLEKLEKAFVRKLFNHVLNEFNKAWQQIQTLGLTILDIQNRPLASSTKKNKEIFIVSNFKIQIGSTSGTMSIALPYLLFHSIVALKELKDTSKPLSNKTLPLVNLKINVTAILGKLHISLAELKSLHRGDVIDLGADINEAIVRIAGENKFKASPGLVGEKKGIILQKFISNQEKTPWTT